MSFQEFASNLFGGRNQFKEKVQKSREVKNAEKEMSGPFSGSLDVSQDKIEARNNLREAKDVFEEANKLEKDLAEKDVGEFDEEDVETGFIPKWLANKKLSKSKRRSNTFGDTTAISGIKEHETNDAILLNVKNDRGTSFREKWIPKSQFDVFESSGPELSESKEEKAENIMESRSKRAQRTDRRNAAPIADSLEEWKSRPSEIDLPGIDTLGSGEDFDDLL